MYREPPGSGWSVLPSSCARHRVRLGRLRFAFLERSAVVPGNELGLAKLIVAAIEFIGGNAAIEDFGLLVDRQDLGLIQFHSLGVEVMFCF